MTRLPRGVERLLAWTVPGDQRDPLAGDLLEEHARLRGASRPGAGARAWVLTWWHAAQLAASFTWERGRRDRTLPPIADEAPSRLSAWETLGADVAFALRLLRRQPSFAVVAIAILALGIGATSTMFSVADAVLWRPLPFPHAGRIVSLGERRPAENRSFGAIAPADFFDWQREAHSFSAMAAYRLPTSGGFALTGDGGEPERVRALEVSPAFLSVLGLVPALGRDFRAGEDVVGRNRVALLSDGLWRRRFGADPAIVGRTAAFDGRTFEIVGVLPASLWWPSRPDVIVPLALDDHDRGLRGAHFLQGIAKLADGSSFAQAREELSVISARLSQAHPDQNTGHAANLQPLRDAWAGDVRLALLVLLGAVGFVLLIACANVATLLLARAAGRQKEMAVRRAIGAGRSRIVRQLLTESLVVAALGGAVGLSVASGAIALMRAVLPASFLGLPGIATVGLDSRTIVATVAFTLATGLVFGAAPALEVSDARFGAALGDDARTSTGSRRASRWRTTLVVAELALSLVLLAGAALLLVSFEHLLNVPTGFQAARLTVSRITLPGARYGEHTTTIAFFDALFDRLASAPGVEHVAVTTALPLDDADPSLDLTIEHREARPGEGAPKAHPRLVSTDFFATLGIPLVRGRIFTPHDVESSPKVAIVNAAAARRYWPGEDPIGRRISLGATDDWHEIVGIVGDVRDQALDADADPVVYLSRRQAFTSLGNGFERTAILIVRSSNDAAGSSALIRSAVASIDAQLAIGRVRTMNEVIDQSIAPRRLNSVLLSIFALGAVLLTAVGLYGVMSYIIAQRTKEIGVRMALGATTRQVLAMTLGQAARMTLAGIAIGLVGALVLTQSMTSLLFGVTPTDPVVYAAAAVLLAVVALASAAGPALRATRIEPVAALRHC